jgi:hypothetical protein
VPSFVPYLGTFIEKGFRAQTCLLESAVVLGDILANMIAGLPPQPAKRQRLVELFVSRELKQRAH